MLMGAGDETFDSEISADSFDSSRRSPADASNPVRSTNEALFLGSRAHQCCDREPEHSQPRHP